MDPAIDDLRLLQQKSQFLLVGEIALPFRDNQRRDLINLDPIADRFDLLHIPLVDGGRQNNLDDSLRHIHFSLQPCPAYMTWLMCMALNLPPLAFAALLSWIRQPGQPVTTTAAPVRSMFARFFARIFAAMSG